MAKINGKDIFFSPIVNMGGNPSGTIDITENGTYDVTEYASASVNVASGGSGEDMLQQMVDQTNSCDYLFFYYTGNSLDFIKALDTSNATSMISTFSSSKIKSVDLSSFDTSNVKDMHMMFSSMSEFSGELDLSSFDTSYVENMSQMFYHFNGNKIKFGNKFTTKKVHSMHFMFGYNKNLISLDLSSFDTSGVISIYNIFDGCTSLETILGVIDLYSASDLGSILNNCSALTTVTLKNIRKELTIGSGTSYGHLLTVDSLVNTIKELWDYSSESTTYKLTMGSANTEKLADVYVKLITPTAEQIAADPYIESKKPCEVCASTDEGAMLISVYANSKGWEIV